MAAPPISNYIDVDGRLVPSAFRIGAGKTLAADNEVTGVVSITAAVAVAVAVTRDTDHRLFSVAGAVTRVDRRHSTWWGNGINEGRTGLCILNIWGWCVLIHVTVSTRHHRSWWGGRCLDIGRIVRFTVRPT